MSGDWLVNMWDLEDTSNFTDMELPSDNVTLLSSCAARSIRGPAMLPFSAALTTTVRSFQTILFILVSVFGILLNSLVIVLVVKYKKLHVRSFAIAFQVVTVNLIFSSTVLLVRPINSIANQWLFGENSCIIAAYIHLTYLLLRTLLMFTFVIDRFLAVFWPFSYPRHSYKIMVILSVSAWVFATVARIVPAILDCYCYVSTSYQCVHSARCGQACVIAANANLAFAFGPATVIPIALYTSLYCKALQFRRKHLRMTEGDGSTNNKMDWKATITFFMLFVALFSFTTPVIFLNILFSSISREILRSPYVFVMRSILSTLTSLLVVVDPIVIMRNKDVKDILLGIIKRKNNPFSQ